MHFTGPASRRSRGPVGRDDKRSKSVIPAQAGIQKAYFGSPTSNFGDDKKQKHTLGARHHGINIVFLLSHPIFLCFSLILNPYSLVHLFRAFPYPLTPYPYTVFIVLSPIP